MPVIRATATTAIPTTRQLASDLARWIRESGPLTAAPNLLEQVDVLARDVNECPLGVDLRTPTALDLTSAFWESFVGPAGLTSADARSDGSTQLALPGGRHAEVRAARQSDAPGTKAGALPPPLLVWIADDDAIDSQSTSLVDAATDRPLVLVVGQQRTGETLRRVARDHAWHVQVIAADVGQRTLTQRLSEPPLLESLDVLRAASVAHALESLAAVFQMAHDAELRGIRAKRAMLQQRASKLPASAGTGRSASDVLSDVRTRLQRQLSEFTRGTEERWAALTYPSGQTWAELESLLASLTALDEQARAKTLSTRVPDKFHDEWTTRLHSILVRSADADVVAMRDLFRVLADDIVQTVARAGGPAIVVNFQFLDRSRFDRVVEQSAASSRPYQGELPRPGMFEYAMIARRYQTLLFMFMSAFGLSFLRTYREFMIPAGIILLTLGGLSVYNSVKRERYEGRKKELDKAREGLRADARRLLTDVQRAWTSLVSQHLSDQVPFVTGQIEALVRDSTARAAEEAGAERQRIQRQLQGYETVERRLVASARGREVAASAIAQFRGELRQLISSALRTAPGA